jgi:hypothetical protein
MTAGVFQVSVQWFCFTLMYVGLSHYCPSKVSLTAVRSFILYMKFYPEHLKYVELDLEAPEAHASLVRVKTPVMSSEWRVSLLCAWVTLGHLCVSLSCLFVLRESCLFGKCSVFSAITTLYLMLTVVPTPAPEVPLPGPVLSWATFLGVTSAILAAIQYAPQLVHTYRHKVVGALSIPMMCMQSPGAVLMILGIALR